MMYATRTELVAAISLALCGDIVWAGSPVAYAAESTRSLGFWGDSADSWGTYGLSGTDQDTGVTYTVKDSAGNQLENMNAWTGNTVSEAVANLLKAAGGTDSNGNTLTISTDIKLSDLKKMDTSITSLGTAVGSDGVTVSKDVTLNLTGTGGDTDKVSLTTSSDTKLSGTKSSDSIEYNGVYISAGTASLDVSGAAVTLSGTVSSQSVTMDSKTKLTADEGTVLKTDSLKMNSATDLQSLTIESLTEGGSVSVTLDDYDSLNDDAKTALQENLLKHVSSGTNVTLNGSAISGTSSAGATLWSNGDGTFAFSTWALSGNFQPTVTGTTLSEQLSSLFGQADAKKTVALYIDNSALVSATSKSA